MFRFLRRLRRRPQPEPLLRAATIYPNRSGGWRLNPPTPAPRKGAHRG